MNASEAIKQIDPSGHGGRAPNPNTVKARRAVQNALAKRAASKAAKAAGKRDGITASELAAETKVGKTATNQALRWFESRYVLEATGSQSTGGRGRPEKVYKIAAVEQFADYV